MSLNLHIQLVDPKQQFPPVAAHWNHSGKLLKTHRCLALLPRDYDLIGLGWSLGTGILQKLPVDANVQSELRTVALEFELLKESLVLV
jgi:hypothetical protein